MTHIEEVVDIINDPELAGLAKRAKIFDYLSDQPDLGISAGIECLLLTDDMRIAEYVAQYLEVTPGAGEEKANAARRLRGEPELLQSAARLVPWLPPDLLDGFIDDYLGQPTARESLSSILYSIGVYWPERLRPVADRIDEERIRKALLAGAGDEAVDALVESWRGDGGSDALISLALIRTDYARTVIRSLRDQVADQATWRMLIELAGELPESQGEAGVWPAHMAFLAEQGKAPHVVGGTTSGEVPICPLCEEPAAHLLTISAEETPFPLRHDPSFYWYSCDCDENESTTVRIDDGVVAVYYGPKGPADPDFSLTDEEFSLTLERHPNQTGVSLRAVPAQALNQVGGLPRWVTPDAHPRCPECSRTMPFIASVGGRETPVGRLYLEGIVYCFWCDDCRVSSTKFQD